MATRQGWDGVWPGVKLAQQVVACVRGQYRRLRAISSCGAVSDAGIPVLHDESLDGMAARRLLFKAEAMQRGGEGLVLGHTSASITHK